MSVLCDATSSREATIVIAIAIPTQFQWPSSMWLTLNLDSLGKRLPRMPFPPITKDSNFDYESALDEHVRILVPSSKSIADHT